MNRFNKVLWVFAFKIFITITLVSLFYCFNETKELNLLDTKYDISAISDKENGGNSVSSMEGRNTIKCFLKEVFYIPYCSLSINLSKDYKKGINLEHYHSILVNVEFDDPHYTKNAPRIYFRNYNEEYSKIEPDLSMKFNGLQLNGYVSGTDSIIGLDKLQVAEWWIERFNVPVKHAGSELTNIPSILFESGVNAGAGEHFITVHKAVLKGNWIEEDKFIFSLLIIWSISSLCILGVVYIEDKHEILELKLINRTITEKSNKDELTGVYNRHAIKSFMEDKNSKFNCCDVVSCVYIDIDFFKYVNDTYGHGVGDTVLIQVSTLIQNSIRKSDYFSRWGGEEFALFCLGSDEKETKELTRSLRSKISKFKFIHGDQVTCSFGITEIKNNETFMEAFDRADKALYEAKNSGRNKIVVY